MKNFKRYIFIITSVVLAFFVMSNNDVRGEESEPIVLEEVVINANSNGEASDVYDVKIPIEPEEGGEEGEEDTEENYVIVTKQFTRTRDITVTININETELATYDSKFKICEVIPEGTAGNTREEEKCSEYPTNVKLHRFQLSGRNDGDKKLKIYFNNIDAGVAARVIEKSISLDTTSPSIELTGGEYIYIPRDKKYSELGATCLDDSYIVSENGCTVIIEEKEISMNKEGYQYITYKAIDFLGNEGIVTRKIMVEVKKKDGGIDLYWYIAGGIVLIVGAFLTYKVIKNKDEQKNASVL